MEKDKAQRHLVIDLDGTLVKTDLFLEAIVRLLSQKVLYIFRIPLWLFKSKTVFKQEVAKRVKLNVVNLPYQESLLDYLKDEYAQGRTLILATAADITYAKSVAEHLGLFQQVFATEHNVNLSGKAKVELLVENFGEGGFDYAGNAMPDFWIWERSYKAIIVNPSLGVKRKATSKLNNVGHLFDDRPSYWKALVQELRLHQWIKNLLVFIPLFAAHKFTAVDDLLAISLTFIAFGLCASSVYLLNDLLDIEHDRLHPTKKSRPLAAGNLPLYQVLLFVPVLLLLATLVSLAISPLVALVLLLYYVLTVTYSLWAKQLLLADVLLLAALYTMRILAGSAAVGSWPSFWLLALSMFFFFSLALLKRYAELLELKKENKISIQGRGYHIDDINLLLPFGAASGYAAVMVLALYINSAEVTLLYGRPQVIWFLCPLLLYWVTRAWLIAHRGIMHSDPIVFAIKDRTSWVLVLLAILILIIAI